jgi:hypothetical protein
MTQAMEDTLAVSDKQAVKLAGISMRQLRYWEQVGLIVPSISEQISPVPARRLRDQDDLSAGVAFLYLAVGILDRVEGVGSGDRQFE